MSQPPDSARVLPKLVSWATPRADVRGIVVVGSHARADHPADPWSDLDVVVTARRPDRYLDETSWLTDIERPWLVVREPTVVGAERILHVTFEGGAKVDAVFVSSFAFAVAAHVLKWLARRPRLRGMLPRVARDRLRLLSDLLGRGFRFALDKDGVGERLYGTIGARAPSGPPSESEFRHLVECFLNEQISMTLKLRRGEFFLVKTLGESRLMELLLQMIEWHTQATSDRWSSVFERGRFLEEWAPAAVVERLRRAFPGYDALDIERARLEAHGLFRGLAEETAARLGYAYPDDLDRCVMDWVRSQGSGPEADATPLADG
jgi:aminoglycoside 6-adenylyltransferase